MQVLNNVKLSFNLNLREPKKKQSKTQLYAVVKVNDEQIKLPLGLKVFTDVWNNKQQSVIITNRMSDEERQYNIAINEKIFAVKGKGSSEK